MGGVSGAPGERRAGAGVTGSMGVFAWFWGEDAPRSRVPFAQFGLRPPASLAVPAPSSDFLEPTLDAKDDFVGFHKPFQPQWVAFVGFLGGPLLTGILLGLNHVKLGGSRWIGLAWFLGCSLIVFPLRVLAGLWGQLLLGAVCVGGLVLHRRRYRVFEMSGGEERVNWWLGIGLILAGRFVTKGAIIALILGLYLALGEESAKELFEWFGIDLSDASAESGGEGGAEGADPAAPGESLEMQPDAEPSKPEESDR